MTLLRIGARAMPVQGVVIFFLLVAQSAGVFLLSGAAQHCALPLILPGASGWFRHTLLGAIVGIPVGLALALLVTWLMSLALRFQRTPMTGGPVDLSAGGLFAAMGMTMLVSVVASIAAAQWRILRRHGRRAGWWPAISVFSWIAGFFTAGKLMFPKQELMEAFLRYLFVDERGKAEGPGIAATLAGGLVMGLLVGGVTGAALIHLLRAHRIFRLFKRDSVTPTLDAIRFDTTGYLAGGEPQPGRLRVWHTPEGDGLGVYLFPLPPDLPAAAGSVDALEGFFRGLLEDSGGKLVALDVVTAGGCRAVRQIVSLPQQPSGRTYVGSLIVPFRDFSFVIKCQCAEGQPTGVKEATLLERRLAANEPIQLEDGRPHFPGFDPDDPQHDAEFPDHPVARARRVLEHVAGSLVVAGDVRALPGFPLP